MKKVLILPLFFLALACQNNIDKEAAVDFAVDTKAIPFSADSTAKWTRNSARFNYSSEGPMNYTDKKLVKGC